MNIGLYQSASALSALERWQDTVAQNITSSQETGFRKRTVEFSAKLAGEWNLDPKGRIGHDSGSPAVFPMLNKGINFQPGEMQATHRELDVAIQGDGYFEVQMPDGKKAYTRSGEFRMRPDRTLVTSAGCEVMNEGGSPILLLPGGGPINVNQDGSIFQGSTSLGKLSVQKFENQNALQPIAGGMFLAGDTTPTPVEKPELMQGYLEASNVTPLREMVDIVLISRAYEANQKIITTVDQQMEKTLDALG